ncbi:unnamed protein product [Moneuplotes crassus]|uniref:Uncharacterized protein n=1 Tax=Euplotes crassus TaxID=5936 RepID=A0AAD2D4S2_EUPCR|nr:unnamed protein product [Moneuplotes crassus]
MSPYTVNVKFIHSKPSQKIIKTLEKFLEEKDVKSLKSSKDLVIGLSSVYKLLKAINPKEEEKQEYFIFALKYAEIGEMLKNLPIVCKIKKQNFYYFPKFIGERTSAIFKVKKCACFAISMKIWKQIADEQIIETLKEYDYDIDWLEDVKDKFEVKQGYLPCIMKKHKILLPSKGKGKGQKPKK